MIAGTSLTIEIGNRALLREASFVVGAGEKVGLVGPNGAGKSSFISVVIGEPSPDVRSSGTVRVQGTFGYLPQVPAPNGLGLDPSAYSHVLSSRGLDVLDDALDRARAAMEKEPTEENIQHFADIEEKFQQSGGYEAEAVMARLADGLGLRQNLLMNDIESLSGGQRRRVDLIRVLFGQPEIMILDEPTNHLDFPAKRWLMSELERFTGAILVVSHDLELLDTSITKVLHLSQGRLREYKGNYSSYRAQFAADQERSERSSALEEREIRRLATLADSMRGSTVRRARTAKSIDRRVARLESTRTEVRRTERTSTFRLPDPPRSGETPLAAEAVSVTYGSSTVISSVGFSARRGDRIIVLGRNGAGKSSLLRCLAGAQEPSTGTVAIGVNTFVGYFAQDHDQVDSNVTALDNISSAILRTETQRRALLGSFGLPGKAASQLPSTLSGGERAKLGLAMLAAGQANLLILDEPTNNLDPSSIAAVGRMLSRWAGTIVVVSHERAFIEALQPTHFIGLPEERFSHWREEMLDQVELR
ncbi:MAG: ABC-F family ATP-binding cassette domain-containing protein [Acidimicrobiales bacterium]